MTTGILKLSHAALALSTGVATFTEETQRQICVKLGRKAAMAAGIEALAQLAIDTGDTENVLFHVVNLASELAAQLQDLANLAGEIAAQQTA